jgi:hypothetical protein
MNTNIYNFAYAMFSISIFAAMIGILGLLSIMWCKFLPANKILYLAWFILSFMMIGFLALGTINYTVTVVTWEVCDSLYQYTHDPAAYKTMVNLLKSD